jgi:hypothetical protein
MNFMLFTHFESLTGGIKHFTIYAHVVHVFGKGRKGRQECV